MDFPTIFQTNCNFENYAAQQENGRRFVDKKLLFFFVLRQAPGTGALRPARHSTSDSVTVTPSAPSSPANSSGESPSIWPSLV